MAATTQAVPGVEISPPDDMDLHTDDGFDFGDGDIELDLDPAPHDEDLSLHDAASDGGLDLETATADQDDFMADHGDLIEEDIYDDDAGSVVMQALADDDTTAHSPMLAPPDEDLIDYSDDEGQQASKAQPTLTHQEDVEIRDGEDEDLSFLSNAPLDDTQEQGFANQTQDEPQDGQEQSLESNPHDNLDTTTHPASDHVHSLEKHESPSPDGHHTDGEDGGIQLSAEETTADVAENNHSLSKSDPQITHNDAHEEYQGIQPITVNYSGSEFWLFKQHDLEDSGDWLLDDISLAKSSMSDLFQACRASLGDDVSNEHELGLCFDHLNSMELYEDNTVCVAVTLERLVNLYYTLQTQDNNAEPEPFYVMLQSRPRFATLLSDVAKFADEERGYFALTNAITAGETHFTNPFALPSEHDEHHSSDYNYAEWNDDNDQYEAHGTEEQENKEQPGEAQESEKNADVQKDQEHAGEVQEVGEHAGEEQAIETTTSELQPDANDPKTENPLEGSHEDVHEEHGDEQETEAYQFGEEQDAQEQPIESEDFEHVTHEEHDDTTHEEPTLEQAPKTDFDQGAVEQPSEYNDVIEEQAEASAPVDKRTPEQILHDKQTEADTVDYSDDEDQDDEPGDVTFNTLSASLTTIQGDESVNVEKTEDTAGSHRAHDASGEVHNVDDQNDEAHAAYDQNEDVHVHDDEEFDFDAEHDGTTLGFDQHIDNEGDDETYQHDAQEYEQDGSLQGFDADTAEGDSLERAFEGETAHDFNEFDYETLGQEVNVDDDGEYDANVADSVAIGEETAGTEDYLDLENAPEWVTDKEPGFELPEDVVLVHDDVTAHDEEGDLGELSAVAASPAADPTTTSPVELTVLSPQGRKRSIDEVGNGTEDAAQVTDAKRPRV